MHEPNSPSTSMLALMVASGPIVTTFHTATTRSLWLTVFQGILRPYHERIAGKIAVSELARRWQMESLGSDAVEIPNGISVSSFADAQPLDGYPSEGGSILFLGRYDEPRKGVDILMRALPAIVERFPKVRVLVVGGGNERALRRRAGALAEHLVFLGQVDDATKARTTFGGRLLRTQPRWGELRYRPGRGDGRGCRRRGQRPQRVPARTRRRAGRSPGTHRIGRGPGNRRHRAARRRHRRAELVARAQARAARYDWSRVADQILRVYETVTVGAGPVIISD